jgi:type II secretory ATPase GspE/PulE/Tfp pilus assembly ATPase PilB-like protein
MTSVGAMAETEKKSESTIVSRINEAQVYCAMGLFDESLNLYESVLPVLSGDDSARILLVNEKIEAIKKAIKVDQKKYTRAMSEEDMATIRNTLSPGSSSSQILNSANAFRELGLAKEAAAEYEILFEYDFPHEEIIPALVEVLLLNHTPSRAVDRIEELIGVARFNDKKKAKIRYLVGLEMEKRNLKELARDLFRAAQEADPENREIKGKRDCLTASISFGSRYDLLMEKGMVTLGQLQRALKTAKKMRRSVETVLVEDFKINKEEVGKSLSRFCQCPFKEFNPELTLPRELAGKLKKSFLLHDTWVPLSWGKEGVEVLVDNPKDLRKVDHIRALIKVKKIAFSVGIKEDIEKFIEQFFQEKAPEARTEDFLESLEEMLPDIHFEEEEENETHGEELDESSSHVVKLVDQILVTAYRKAASDIHIEPSVVLKKTGIRLRIDGICQEYLQIPNSMANGVISRLKIMSSLDISERRLPQDGKIKFKRKGIPPFELRIATIPTAEGFEDAVLRILPKSGAMKLDGMGLSERNLDVMKRIIGKPYGLVLVVGPTGSGKTTTLHSSLGYINKPGVKIWTAEDPVEITQPGLRQVEAKPKIGLNFERIMRAFLRADPDVIMIGEMRDKETASIGVEASLTGHLVFSTLHTNSAPETVTRLLDIGLNPLNFSDAFLGVLAQRLVRRLCKECREKYHPSPEEFEELIVDYGKNHFEKAGIHYSADLLLYRRKGCETCSGTGYKGRLGIHELMDGTPEIKRMIKKQAPTEELFTQAMKEGMVTLKQDGIQKVFQGLTDIHEVRRVCIE